MTAQNLKSLHSNWDESLSVAAAHSWQIGGRSSLWTLLAVTTQAPANGSSSQIAARASSTSATAVQHVQAQTAVQDCCGH